MIDLSRGWWSRETFLFYMRWAGIIAVIALPAASVGYNKGYEHGALWGAEQAVDMVLDRLSQRCPR